MENAQQLLEALRNDSLVSEKALRNCLQIWAKERTARDSTQRKLLLELLSHILKNLDRRARDIKIFASSILFQCYHFNGLNLISLIDVDGFSGCLGDLGLECGNYKLLHVYVLRAFLSNGLLIDPELCPLLLLGYCKYLDVKIDPEARAQAFQGVHAWILMARKRKDFVLNPSVMHVILSKSLSFFDESDDSCRRLMDDIVSALVEALFKPKFGFESLQSHFFEWYRESASSLRKRLCICLNIIPVIDFEAIVNLNISDLILECLEVNEFISKASEILALVIEKFCQDPHILKQDFHDYWISTLCKVIMGYGSAARSSVLTSCIPVLVRFKPVAELFERHLKSLEPKTVGQEYALITLLKNGQQTIIDNDLGHYLLHRHLEIRFEAFSILCERELVLDKKLFDMCFLFIRYTVNDCSSDFRGSFADLLKKLLQKLTRKVSAFLVMSKKEGSKDDIDFACSHQVKLVFRFIDDCLEFVQDIVSKDTPYHLLCSLFSVVKSLFIFYRTHDGVCLPNLETWSFNLEKVFSILGVFLNSTYEDVRLKSINLLSELPYREIMSFETVLSQYIDSPNADLSKCGSYFLLHQFRNGMTDSLQKVSYISNLIGLLKHRLSVSNGDIGFASKNYPLQGLLWALNQIFVDCNLETFSSFQQIQALVDDMLSAQSMIYDLVMPILCNTSPEGYSLFSLAEMDLSVQEIAKTLSTLPSEKDVTQNSQLLMAFCWRSLTDSCTIYCTLLQKFLLPMKTHKSGEFENWIDDVVVKGCENVKTIMLSMRHCGAFGSISPLFASLCGMLVEAGKPFTDIIHRWVDQISLEVCSKSKESSFTRRSAGLPFAVVSILCSDVDGREGLFNKIVDYLADLLNGGDVDDCGRVHALNILNGITNESVLKKRVISRMDNLLTISLTGLSSANWSVRNSATMLFASLMLRTFGSTVKVNDSSANFSASLFFSRYPGLESFVLECFEKSLNSEGLDTVVYACLLLLSKFSRVKFSRDLCEELNLSSSTFKKLIRQSLASPKYRIRSVASRAFVSLTSFEGRSEAVAFILSEIKGDLDSNLLHGLLLILSNLVIDDDLPQIQQVFQPWIYLERHPMISSLAQSICPCNQSFIRDLSGGVHYNTPTEDDLDEKYILTLFGNLAAKRYPYEVFDRAIESCLSNLRETKDLKLKRTFINCLEEIVLSGAWETALHCSTRIILASSSSWAKDSSFSENFISYCKDRLVGQVEPPLEMKRNLLTFLQGSINLDGFGSIALRYSSETEPACIRALVSQLIPSVSSLNRDWLLSFVNLLSDDDSSIRAMASERISRNFGFCDSLCKSTSYLLHLTLNELRKLNNEDTDADESGLDFHHLGCNEKSQKTLFCKEKLNQYRDLHYIRYLLKTTKISD